MARADPRDEALARDMQLLENELAGAYLDLEDRGLLKVSNDVPKTEQVPLLHFIPIGAFLSTVTAPKWLIRDIAELDSLLLVFGDPAAGKSFLVMDWAACIATGRDWNGYATRKGPVLYINGEGRNGVNRRFTAWAIAHQADLASAPLFVSNTTTALTDEVSRAELVAVVAEFIRTHGEPVLIVIDTLARNYGTGDENSTQDMTQAIATCDAIRELTHAAVALVHHSGHGDKGRARGAMALRGAIDAEYRMQRVPDTHDTTFECTKMKDADEPAPMQFRFTSVELGVQDDLGREVTSAVLKRVDVTPSNEPPKDKGGRPAGTSKHLGTALHTLQRLYAKAVRNVVKDGREPSDARVPNETWRDACLGNGMPRQRFAEALAQLKAAEKIRFDYGFVYPVEEE